MKPAVTTPPVVQPVNLTIAQGESSSFSLVGTGLKAAELSIETDAKKVHITESAANADGTKVDFKASADTDCPPNKYKLTVQTTNGTQTTEIAVTAQAPKPDKGSTAKTNPDPDSLTQGDSKPVVISGAFLDNVAATILKADAKKITLGKYTPPEPVKTPQTQTLTLPMAIAKDAIPGKYQIQLKRFDQITDLDFEIRGLNPTVTTLTATGKGTSDKPYQLTIEGTNLATAIVTVPEGSAIPQPSCKSTATKLTCGIDTSKAKAGDIVELTVINGDVAANKTLKFTVAK